MSGTENPTPAIVSTPPTHRIGLPKEVAALVASLCSADSGFSTGALASVNSGETELGG